MNIAFIEPFSRAWNRMTKALFKPFDIGKWFVIGFTAFLAGLMESNGGGGAGSSRNELDGRHAFGDVLDFPAVAWGWLMDNPGWFTLIIFGVLFLLAIIIVFTWLSSRGKFMFLDNVVHDRAMVTQPWREYRTEGNSLFVWRFVFGWICFAVIILFLVQAFFVALDIYESDFSSQHVLIIIGMAMLLLLVILIIVYILAFLNHFVIPIMYKYKISATQAWRRFLPLFSKHWFHFIAFGLFMFLLNIVALIAIFMFILFTCCIGLLLLIIPYINAVVTLPISYTFKAFGPEFLTQFGAEFDIFPKEETPATSEG